MKDGLVGAAIAAALLAATPAAAQTAAGTAAGPSGALGGGIFGKMLGSAVGGTSAGNAAGLLSYCLKNKLVGGDAAKSTLGSLLGRSDVAASQGFAAGQDGTVVAGRSSGVSLDQLTGKLKTKACDMVLQRARSIL